MFAIVVNETKRQFAVVPYALAETKLPENWYMESWNEKESILRRGSIYPNTVWKDFEEISPDLFKNQEFELREETLKLELTKSGRGALWESGGGMGSRGSSQIICDANGEPKKPIYVRTKGQLSNGDHALFIVNKGDHVIQISNRDGDCTIYRVVGFQDEPILDEWDDDEDLLMGMSLLASFSKKPTTQQKEKPKAKYARCEVVAGKKNKAWWPDLPEHLQAAYKAAVKKANEYHCRRALYTK